MLFCLAWFFNFLIGGLSGVFLSDVPSDVTTHGSFFSMAHFHYTIMGGLVFTFFAAIYYWLPKMTGFELNERLGKIHFWMMFISFNSTFAPLFARRLPRAAAPRRRPTRRNLQSLNDWVSVSAFVLGALDARLPLQPRLLARSSRACPPRQNPWASRSLEWQLPSPVPVHNFDRIPVITGDPYDYGEGAGAGRLPAGAPAGGSDDERARAPTKAPSYEIVEERAARAAGPQPHLGGTCSRARPRSSSSPSSSRTSTSAR